MKMTSKKQLVASALIPDEQGRIFVQRRALERRRGDALRQASRQLPCLRSTRANQGLGELDKSIALMWGLSSNLAAAAAAAAK